jgi:transposase-like protein
MTLGQLKRTYSTEEKCLATLTKLRWPDGVRCPRCRSKDRIYALKARPFHWTCKNADCGGRNGYRFSVLKGSIFENSNVKLPLWFEVIYLMCTSKKGISANQIARMLDASQGGKKADYRTAWYMCHRVRVAMGSEGFDPFSGEVEIDETYVGGSTRNRHRSAKTIKRSKLIGCKDDKTPVIGAYDRSGRITAKVLSRVTAKEMHRFVRQVVADDVSLVATDDHAGYRNLYRHKLPHQAVNHAAGEYVRETVHGKVHTANIDSFWSLLKRGIMGTFHQVSREYLPLYVSEFSFRYNHRNDPDIFRSVLSSC